MSLTVTVNTEAGSSEGIVVTKSADKEAIRKFLALFPTASRASEHKCASDVNVQIQKKDGTTIEVRFLPGHDEEFYEYRYESRINRVKRKLFLDAMRKLGVKLLPLEGNRDAKTI